MSEIKEKFTPGQWYRTKREPIRYDYYGKPCQFSRIEITDTPDGKYKPRHVIAQVTYANGKGEANADLLTVAPDMYFALKDMVLTVTDLLEAICSGEENTDCLLAVVQEEIDNAVKVLKKARGEE